MAWVAVAGGVIAAAGAVGGAMISNSGKKSALDAYNSSSNKALATSNKALADYQGRIDGVKAPKVDWLGAAGSALGFDQAHMQDFINMADQQSKAGTQTLLAQEQAANPKFTQTRDTANQNNLSLMQGNVPIDVQQTLARSGAFKQLQNGTGGSGLGRNANARDLGLTSLNLMQQGDQSAQRWTSLLNDALVKPAFVSPFQTMQFGGISASQGIGAAFQQGQLDMQAQALQEQMAGQALQGQFGLTGQQLGLASNNYMAQAGMADTWGKAMSSAAGSIGGGVAGMGYSNLGGGSGLFGNSPALSAMNATPKAQPVGSNSWDRSLYNTQTAANLAGGGWGGRSGVTGWGNIGNATNNKGVF